MAKVTRRSLVGISAGAGLCAGLTGCAKSPKGPWQQLSEEEGRTLELVCEQILPSDKDPGAREAGAAQYIDRQLALRLRTYRDRYRKGLAALQDSSREKYGRSFEQLNWGEQTDLLKAVEAAEVNQSHWPHESSKSFFALVRDHTIDGVFSIPRHGGNRGLAGYRLLGWEYPEPRGQNRYTDRRFHRK